MRELIARLINCGFERETAVTIACTFRRTKNLHDLEKYVEAVEEEIRYKEEYEP